MQKIVYCKNSIDRKREFRIQTLIQFNDKNKIKEVIKKSYSSKMDNHIQSMDKYYKYLIGKDIKHENIRIVYPKRVEKDSLYFDYIDGRSMDWILFDNIKSSDFEELYKNLGCYKNIVLNFHKISMDSVKEDPVGYDDILFDQNTSNFKNGYLNLDLTFENIIKNLDTYNIIDIEWMFKKNVSIKYVFYRAVKNFYEKYYSHLTERINIEKLYVFFDISVREREEYFEYEKKFQSYVKGQSEFESNFDMYNNNRIKISNLIDSNIDMTKVYFSVNESYSENNSIQKRIFLNQNYNLRIQIPNKYDGVIKEIRWDPTEFPCKVKVYKITTVNEKDEKHEISLEKLRYENYNKVGEWVEFNYSDPKIFIPIGDKIKFMKINFFIDSIDKLQYYSSKLKRIEKLKHMIELSTEKNKKIFGEYRKYKDETNEINIKLRSEIDLLSKEKNKLEIELVNIDSEKNKFKYENKKIRSEILFEQKKNKTLNLDIEKEKQRIFQMSQKNKSSEKIINKLKNENNSLKEIICKIEASMKKTEIMNLGFKELQKENLRRKE